MKKSIKFLTVGILFVGMIALTGCRKEGCMNKNAINYSPSAKKHKASSCKYVQTGNLNVYVKNYLGNAVSGREVWLYTNETDFNNADAFLIKVTNSQGMVSFTGLDAGTYWVDCLFYDVFGNAILAEGKTTVSGNKTTTKTITP